MKRRMLYVNAAMLAVLAVLYLPTPAISQAVTVLFGSSAGVAVPVAVNSSGAMSVAVVSGQAPTVLNTDTTQTCTAANVNETTLFSYTLPASTLTTDGQALRLTTWGSLGATATAKTLRLKAVANIIAFTTATTAASAGHFRAQALFQRTGASAEISSGDAYMGPDDGSAIIATSWRSVRLTHAVATSGTIAFTLTGQNGTANANDICFQGAIVEFVK